jgi:hypothetical protein
LWRRSPPWEGTASSGYKLWPVGCAEFNVLDAVRAGLTARIGIGAGA